jgi:hypothetical protein
MAKVGGNYPLSRLWTLRASAITWQSTETPSPFSADFKTSRLRSTRAAAACTQILTLKCACCSRCDAQQRTSKSVTVSCSTRQTRSARKHWHDKRSAEHSTRAAAAAPALSSRDPGSHAPLSTQPSAPLSCTSRAHRQARWPVDGTRSPSSRT